MDANLSEGRGLQLWLWLLPNGQPLTLGQPCERIFPVAKVIGYLSPNASHPWAYISIIALPASSCSKEYNPYCKGHRRYLKRQKLDLVVCSALLHYSEVEHRQAMLPTLLNIYRESSA